MRLAYRNLIVVIVLTAGSAFTFWHAQGPTPKPLSAARNVFSAERSAAVLSELTGDGIPHPVGSRGHDAVRERILGRLRALGYAPAVEKGFACSASGVCAPVENITAVVPGAAAQPAVMLAAHYDSVPAGPGASDDGAGVATLLEIARILATEPPRRNPIVLLFDDGEEAGLLGAESFEAHSPWAKRVAVVVNVEARGTRGESFMFETSAGHRWLIDLMARNVPRPDTSSLFYEIYKRLPNDTDFTVFKRAGKEGLNFAYLGDVSHYHTRRDDVANTSHRSLQHHGDNVLAMARALGGADLRHRDRRELVWFDLLSRSIVRWPVPWSLPMAVAALLVAVVATVGGRRRDVAIVRRTGIGALWFVAAIVTDGLVMLGLGAIVRVRVGGVAWPAHPLGVVLAGCLFGVLVPMALASFFGKRAGERGIAAGSALAWAVLAVVTAFAVPGASYLFLPVAILLALSLLVDSFLDRSMFALVSSILRAITTALAVGILLPLAWSLYDALGLPGLVVSSLLVAFVSTTWCDLVVLWPPRAASVLSGFLAILALVSTLGTALQPPYSRSSPQRLNILLHADVDRQTAQWLTGIAFRDLPAALARAARWTRVSPFPWYANASYNACRTPILAAAAPRVTVSEMPLTGQRRLVLRIHSLRGADTIAMNLHDGGRLRAARVNGWPVSLFAERYRRWLSPGWTRLAVRGGADVELDLTLAGSQPIQAVVEDQSYGLPPAGARLIEARGPLAVPSDSGDLTIVTHALSF